MCKKIQDKMVTSVVNLVFKKAIESYILLLVLSEKTISYFGGLNATRK